MFYYTKLCSISICLYVLICTNVFLHTKTLPLNMFEMGWFGQSTPGFDGRISPLFYITPKNKHMHSIGLKQATFMSGHVFFLVHFETLCNKYIGLNIPPQKMSFFRMANSFLVDLKNRRSVRCIPSKREVKLD